MQKKNKFNTKISNEYELYSNEIKSSFSFIEDGNLIKASQSFNNLLDKKISNHSLLVDIADGYLKLDRPDKAIEALKKIKPDNILSTSVQIKLADAYISLGKDKFSESIYKNILKHNTDKYDVLIKLGKLYENQKRFEESKLCYKNILNYDSKNYSALIAFAEYYKTIKKYSLARKYFKKALKANINSKKAKNNLTRLNYYFLARLIVGPIEKVINYFFSKKLIQFGSLNSFVRFSFLIGHLEPYLRQLKLDGYDNFLIFVLFDSDPKAANEFLVKKYGRKYRFIKLNRVMRKIYRLYLKLLETAGSPLYANFVFYRKYDSWISYDSWKKGAPVLKFTKEENKKGWDYLNQLGIPKGAEFICLGKRDRAYYELYMKLMSHKNPSNKQEKTYFQIPPLENYIELSKYLANQGLYVVRIGLKSSESLPKNIHPNIIDCTVLPRDAFGEIFLIANCKFMIAGTTGLIYGAAAFDRPFLVTDIWNLGGSQVSSNKSGISNMILPNHIWSNEENRYLTFRELINYSDKFTWKSDFDKNNLRIEFNSKNELISAADEMNKRIDRTWKPQAIDKRLQNQLNSMYLPKHIGYKNTAIVSSIFLRENTEMLEI